MSREQGPRAAGCDRPRLPPDADNGYLESKTTIRRRRHEQGAGAPRSGDATGRDCRRTPTWIPGVQDNDSEAAA